MEMLNLLLSISGFLGWCWVWFCGKYQTGRTIRTQVGVMMMGLVWLLLILSDTVQNLQPTTGTIAARIVFALALFALMPLLKYRRNIKKRGG